MAALNLRRRKGKDTQLIRTWALSLFCFCSIVYIFATPPLLSVPDDSSSSKVIGGHNDSPLVECKVSTPNSKNPNQAANGVLRIKVFPGQPSSDTFLKLVGEGFYDEAYTFRVVKGFVVQWGFKPHVHAKLKREPDPPKTYSNIRGTLTMVGGPTGQVFINMGDNSRLDKERTVPFATLDEASMALADSIYTGYKEGTGQISAIRDGKVAEMFPEMSVIESCRVAT
jgi:cyclophilin family peptidyl-prolyl cis-trans isomerase